jgi:hypothetical protein
MPARGTSDFTRAFLIPPHSTSSGPFHRPASTNVLNAPQFTLTMSMLDSRTCIDEKLSPTCSDAETYPEVTAAICIHPPERGGRVLSPRYQLNKAGNSSIAGPDLPRTEPRVHASGVIYPVWRGVGVSLDCYLLAVE